MHKGLHDPLIQIPSGDGVQSAVSFSAIHTKLKPTEFWLLMFGVYLCICSKPTVFCICSKLTVIYYSTSLPYFVFILFLIPRYCDVGTVVTVAPAVIVVDHHNNCGVIIPFQVIDTWLVITFIRNGMKNANF